MNKLISVAMTTYNGEKYLAEQIDSILSQTYTDFELIVCDDCSTDSTRSILKEYEQKDKRIKLYFNEANLGFKKNFEQALHFCTGEFIAFADQDDVWFKDHLEILITNIGSADLIGGNALVTDSSLNPLGFTMQDVTGIKTDNSTSDFLFLHELYSNIFQGTACLLRSTLLDFLLPVPECALFHDHWAALVAGINNGLQYTEKPVLFYRQHEKQITENPKQTIFTAIKQSLEKQENCKIQREHLVQMLKQIILKTDDEEKKLRILKAIEYNENLLSGKRIAALKHFVENYPIIYTKSGVIFYILRFMKILLGII